jgi:hypothetical protein
LILADYHAGPPYRDFSIPDKDASVYKSGMIKTREEERGYHPTQDSLKIFIHWILSGLGKILHDEFLSVAKKLFATKDNEHLVSVFSAAVRRSLVKQEIAALRSTAVKRLPEVLDLHVHRILEEDFPGQKKIVKRLFRTLRGLILGKKGGALVRFLVLLFFNFFFFRLWGIIVSLRSLVVHVDSHLAQISLQIELGIKKILARANRKESEEDGGEEDDGEEEDDQEDDGEEDEYKEDDGKEDDDEEDDDEQDEGKEEQAEGEEEQDEGEGEQSSKPKTTREFFDNEISNFIKQLVLTPAYSHFVCFLTFVDTHGSSLHIRSYKKKEDIVTKLKNLQGLNMAELTAKYLHPSLQADFSRVTPRSSNAAGGDEESQWVDTAKASGMASVLRFFFQARNSFFISCCSRGFMSNSFSSPPLPRRSCSSSESEAVAVARTVEWMPPPAAWICRYVAPLIFISNSWMRDPAHI